MKDNKKPYHVIKLLICSLSGEGCGDSCDYRESLLIPDCENCDIYQESEVKGE